MAAIRIHPRHFILISFIISLYSILFSQNSVVVHAIKDNTLYESSTGSLSNGAGEFFFAGRTNSGSIRRALIAFDIAGNIPVGAIVDSVFLTLHMSRTISGVHSLELHRVLADWGESTSDAPANEGGGAAASAGDATWIHTFFDTSFWASPGGDFSPSASASVAIEDTGFYTWGSTPELVADVQTWLDTPSKNYGWLLLGDESSFPTSKRFDSRQNPVLASRPRLTIFYSTSTAIKNDPTNIPRSFSLLQNHPNPFNPTTEIPFRLDLKGLAVLKVYNLLGQEVAMLVNRVLSSGTYRVRFDAQDLPAGVYFYRLQFQGQSRVRKMVILK